MRMEPVEGLDAVSRWLIATRSVVFVMTVNSVIIGGLLYVLTAGFGPRIPPPFVLVVMGLVFARGEVPTTMANLKHGIDTSKDYFRPAYMPHPSLSGMMSPQGLFWRGPWRLRPEDGGVRPARRAGGHWLSSRGARGVVSDGLRGRAPASKAHRAWRTDRVRRVGATVGVRQTSSSSRGLLGMGPGRVSTLRGQRDDRPLRKRIDNQGLTPSSESERFR